MPQDSFTATVNAWVSATKERTIAVRNESTQRIVDIMQTPVGAGGNMPVKTGFLRSSLLGCIGDPAFPTVPNPNPNGGFSFNFDIGQISLVIAGAKITDTISIVYTANYAIHQEYGTEKMSARRFVGLAAQQWQQVVSQVCADAQSTVQGK